MITLNTWTNWNPDQYGLYKNERLRPGIDLFEQITIESPKTIYDLGCGTGTLTNLLHNKWPGASVIGVDSSETMLGKANEAYPDIIWENSQLQNWKPNVNPDIIYTNAALHWIDNHSEIIPGWIKSLNPNGIFAMQVPNNWREPSHSNLAKVVRSGDWNNKLLPKLRELPILSIEEYYDLLNPITSHINIWETTYIQILEGVNPVLEWLKGTLIPPLLDLLDKKEQLLFIDQYAQLVSRDYPIRKDGKTIFPFKRLFIVATK
ncbi:MAG: trans-aconitate 2-methyltransferase [Chloroflexi bacterium]|nr:trans-aconitate 2-methyltransferase [Chloroflexota bacterium]|tara:strand:+ start:19976 stop:20761 length:786 start_codon:yes stop_codon:yes gene_type:complete